MKLIPASEAQETAKAFHSKNKHLIVWILMIDKAANQGHLHVDLPADKYSMFHAERLIDIGDPEFIIALHTLIGLGYKIESFSDAHSGSSFIYKNRIRITWYLPHGASDLTY